MKKELVLTFASAIIITGFFLLPANRRWLQERIFPYYAGLSYQFSHQSIEDRKRDRWKSDYTYAKKIKELADSIVQDHDKMILVPPTKYFRDRGIEFHVPEPAVFYYYTGLKTTCATCDSSRAAHFYVTVVNKQLQITEVADPLSYLQFLASLKQYKPEL